MVLVPNGDQKQYVDLTHKWRLDLPSQEYFLHQVLSRIDGGREDDDRSRKDDRLDGTG